MLPLRDLNGRVRTPVVTWSLVALNVAVFFVVQPSVFASLSTGYGGSVVESRFLYEHALVPCEVTHWEALTPALVDTCGGTPVGPADNEPFFPGKSIALSILAAMFFHANLLHLAGNLWFLWIFGDNVEDRLGHVGFLALYLLGGVAASLGQVLSEPGSIIPFVGASGAIAVVMGAYLVLFPRARIVTVLVPLFFLPFLVPAVVLLGFWFALQFFTDPGSGVGWVAHVTGFVVGAAVALALAGRSRPPVSARPA